MSIVTLRRADTLAESAERESLFCLVGGVRLGVVQVALRERVVLPFALVGFGHGCGGCSIGWWSGRLLVVVVCKGRAGGLLCSGVLS